MILRIILIINTSIIFTNLIQSTNSSGLDDHHEILNEDLNLPSISASPDIEMFDINYFSNLHYKRSLISTTVVTADSTPPSFNQLLPICNLDSLDGLQFDMLALDSLQPWPGCNLTISDPNWVTFVSGGDSIHFGISVNSCLMDIGLQIEVFKISDTFTLGPNQPYIHIANLEEGLTNCVYAAFPQPAGTLIDISIPTEVGVAYGIFLDGWAGDLCSVDFILYQGVSPSTNDSISISPPTWQSDGGGSTGDTLCIGYGDIIFQTADTNIGQNIFTWFIEGTEISDETAPQINIDFLEIGTFEVCHFASNRCNTSALSCTAITVIDCDTNYVVDGSGILILHDLMRSHINFVGELYDYNISIVDLIGNTIVSYPTFRETLSIHPPNLPAGMYFLIIENFYDNVVRVERFLVH